MYFLLRVGIWCVALGGLIKEPLHQQIQFFFSRSLRISQVPMLLSEAADCERMLSDIFLCGDSLKTHQVSSWSHNKCSLSSDCYNLYSFYRGNKQSVSHVTTSLTSCFCSSCSSPPSSSPSGSPFPLSSHIFCVSLVNSPFPSWQLRERERETRTVLQCGLAALSLLHMQWDLSSVPGALALPC